MKTVMRNWPWLAGLMAAGLICLSFLLTQLQSTLWVANAQSVEDDRTLLAPPNEVEAAASESLVEAVNSGAVENALTILHDYGVAEDVVLDMATSLGKIPPRAGLKEPFAKAAVALSLAGRTNDVQVRLDAAASLGYERPVWVARWLETNWVERCDVELLRSPLAPIAVLNIKPDDPNFIRFFQWYDRYAEHLHSVVLNGDALTNAKLKEGYDHANRTLNAIFKLIKSRKPDAFVWLSVVKEDDRTDEQWLKAMTFRPDGLQISNLRQFHSPFAETRRRYVGILGSEMPMMVTGFYGHKAALQEKEKMLSAANKITDPQIREAAKAEATAQLGGIGTVIGSDLAQLEADLQTMGYSGISAHWLLIEALANRHRAANIETSDILDRRVGLLHSYYLKTNYAQISSLTAALLSESAPGDMNWTVAKTYDAIVLLSQVPPKTQEAVPILEEVLAFDFKDKTGRDYYVLLAARWRVHAALLSADVAKARELVTWVQDGEFRKDLKASFLRHYGEVLTMQTTPRK